MNKRQERKLSKIQELYATARSGEPRPKIGTALGNALCNYTSVNSRSFDEVFTATVRSMRPDWFGRNITMRQRDITPPEDAKKAMIGMALNRDKIDLTHPWYHRLRRYTNPNSRYFDEDFAKVIMLLAPEWSERSHQRVGDAESNKAAILLAAQAGWDKPSRQTKMGQVLSTYLSVNHESYDGVFLARLMKLRPDWFRDTVTKKTTV